VAPKGVSSSLADPHRIGPFGGWHFGSTAGRTLRGVAPLCVVSISSSEHDLRVRVSHGETRPSHEDGSRPGRLSSRRGCAGYRRRVKTRGGLDGKTVIDRSSVSALGSSPIRQREVLLARVLLPLRAKSVDRKGSTTGAASARDAPFSPSGESRRPSRSSLQSSRYAQPRFSPPAAHAVGRKEGLQRGFDEVVEV
jgi:hypothetical protein